MYTHTHTYTHTIHTVVSQEELTLQQLCIQNISRSISSPDHAKDLPLPQKLQKAIEDHHGNVYTGFVPERYKKIWNFLFEDKKYKNSSYSRFADFFKFCLVDKRRSEDPYFVERMHRRSREDREGGDQGSRRRRRDRGDHLHDELMFGDFPWKDKDFFS